MREHLERAAPGRRRSRRGVRRHRRRGGPRRWVIDPIDGTKNFVRGVPVWATLIALQLDERTVVGVVSAPALGRRWWAASGAGAWTGPSDPRARAPCRVSRVAELVRRLPRLLLAVRLGGPRPAAAVRRADAPGLADPRVRRLLVAHDGRRGRGRRLVRAGAARCGTSPRCRSIVDRGRRPVHRPVRRRPRRRRQRGVQQRAACTTPCSARCPARRRRPASAG